MIIGILGKGGSGKSTVSTQLVKYLHHNDHNVLAIDADHNMDLVYNLGVANTDQILPLGQAYTEIKVLFGLGENGKFKDGLSTSVNAPSFKISPPDDFTTKYSYQIADKLSVMMAGPQIDSVLYGKLCSHSLAAPLKLYLPYLQLAEKDFVVVDEKASADAASTGIPTGFDLALVVVEPREQSLRAGQQILQTLSWYNVPTAIVWNKWPEEVSDSILKIAETLPAPLVTLRPSLDPLASIVDMSSIVNHVRQVSQPNESRLKRSQAKYQKAEQYDPDIAL